jgi:WD40 repeat protein
VFFALLFILLPRYLSLYDHSYQRSFHGHTAPTSSLAMCPADDSFATGSDDGTVRLWNLKASKSLACLSLPAGSSAPHVAYDPTGKVFACAYQNSPSSGGGGGHVAKLYDGGCCISPPRMITCLSGF